MKIRWNAFVFVLCLLAGIFPDVYATETITYPLPGEKVLLNSGWIARRANEVSADGNTLSAHRFDQTGWMPARVPGTVLATMLDNGLFPAPEFGVNNNRIPDIYEIGSPFYTFWFVKEFDASALPKGKRAWLNFRGINYKADIFLNGKRINPVTHEGMFLRKSFDITPQLHEGRPNILAVIVYPPTYPGEPNGGQGGDGMIARNNTMQYTPGWDWIQPVRDRNTGIWDEVSITTSGAVKVEHPYVVTKVPGIRSPKEGKQKEAYIKTSVELQNNTDQPQSGILVCETEGQTIQQPVSLLPKERKQVVLKELTIRNPRLWWPNGIGEHPLYGMHIRFEQGTQISDRESLHYGIREITTEKDPVTGGRMFFVNGQKIYISGGNYINSDWLLRLSPERYRDEVRFHAEMNLQMIRVWGGALLERPEFYAACDAYGLLVFQDLWGSGDCNGAWEDPAKRESRQRRWEYPDNHDLFIASVEDQVKMVRNHPSLCFWCGANEWPLAKEVDERLKTEVFPRVDPERLFVSFSTDTLFTRNLLGDNGDGPYGIQEPEWYFTFRSHPFNPEAGSVGSPEIESMREMMSEEDLAQFPRKGRTRNYTWNYHKDLGYQDQLERFGKVEDIETYCKHAQVVNYDQYRSFMEGWASRMWTWYTGILIWKTQNPWTALRGQMYDWSLDVNASLYGTRNGCEPLHPFYNPVSKQIGLINRNVYECKGLFVKAQVYRLDGACIWEKEVSTEMEASSVKALFAATDPQGIAGVYFLKLTLSDRTGKEPLTSNIYWLTTLPKDYSTLYQLPKTVPVIQAALTNEGPNYTGTVSLKANREISFFNRIKVFDRQTGKRILPVHYSDNYITLMPGDERVIGLDFSTSLPKERIQIVVDSWTADRIVCPLGQ